MLRLFLPIGFLLTASLVLLSSISQELFFLEIVWLCLGALVVAFFISLDWRALFNYRWFVPGLYLITILLLVVVYLKGPLINQTKSWLVLGPLNFQPVELAKISLILVYAKYFSRRHLSIARWSHILTSFFYFLIPAVLVALQPDLGSASVLFIIWLGFLLVSGLPTRRIVIGLVILAAFSLLMWHSGLRDYQRDRIVGVFFPERDTLSINYSVNQSKIAIGSAGFFGKGYGQGTQTQLGFLTEPATDFIFAALVEEWGLIAGILVIAAFVFLIFGILKIASITERNFEKFICLGTALAIGWQFFLNVGSTIGLSPVVGVTFPFLSYGGSSLLTSFFLIAIINSIARKL